MPISRRSALRTLARSMPGLLAGPGQDPLVVGVCDGRDLEGFTSYCFTPTGAAQRTVYVADGHGPPVILLHELPGLVDADLDAALRLSREGFTVLVPLLFGTPGGKGHTARYARQVCGDDQFRCGQGAQTSPHVAWLAQMAREARRLWPAGRGVGVVGMCLTGMFPLAMLREPCVVAPVLLQPTLPFRAWNPRGWFTDKRALGINPEDLKHAVGRTDVAVLGIRYTDDWRCHPQRFERLADDFDRRFFRLDLNGGGHSTIGSSFCPQAFAEVCRFLHHALRAVDDPRHASFPLSSRPGSRTANVVACGWHHRDGP